MGNLKKYDLTTGSVGGHLIRLTLPMLWGFLSMSAFNLTDTYFVSRLGTHALAAMSFTFPVITVLICIARGIGVGATSAISRTLGTGDDDKVKRLATDSLIMVVIIVGIVAVTGYFTIDPLFRTLGAPDTLLPVIREYMTVWYIGVAFMFIPMISNHILRSLGSTVLPAIQMCIAVVFNIILDPLLIFGLCGFPQMGITGAAIATVVSRMFTLIFALSLLIFKYRIISYQIPTLRELLDSWKKILHVALPSAATNVLQPVSNGFITGTAATFGTAAVASVGAGTRIQFFCYAIPAALALILIPFVGQNWGGKFVSRVNKSWKQSCLFSLIYSAVCLAIFAFAAHPVASWFSDDPEVVHLICVNLYINITFSGMLHVCTIASTVFNAMGKPFSSGLLGLIRFIVLTIPLAFIFSRTIGVTGVFWGMGIANLITGIISFFWVQKVLKTAADNYQA